MENEQHWFVCTGDTWITDPDLFSALKRLEKATCIKGAYYIVVEVPLPPTATYKINNYLPLVEGIKVVAEGKFSGGAK
jgi:hypothetical protein